MPDELVNVRYMVDDVEAAVDFYTTHFGFDRCAPTPPPAFADVVRGNLRLLLSGPPARPGGRCPTAARRARRLEPHPPDRRRHRGEVERLRAAGLTFRNDIVSGPGGQQILLEDPAGNPIELFQPAGA